MEYKGLQDVLVRMAAREPSGKGRTSPLSVAWASTRGTSRQDNQDRLIVGLAPSGLAFAVLADGMGGMKEGARAAALAVAATATHCVGNATGALDRLLDGALRFANDEVFRLLRGDGGAAVVLAAWKDGARFVAHAGDARAYSVAGPEDPPIKQLTIDDTLDAELARLGRRRESEPELHRGLVQFIGVGPDLEPHVAAVPDGSRGLVLSTDGVHSIPAVVLEWIVRGTAQLQLLPERLVAASEWHGGRDNATAIVVGLQNGASAEPVGAADFWIAGDRVAVPVTATPQVPARPEAKPSAHVALRAPGRATRGKQGGGGKRAKPRTREAQPREPLKQATRLPLVDFDVPSAREAGGSIPAQALLRDASPPTPAAASEPGPAIVPATTTCTDDARMTPGETEPAAGDKP
jgi:serine/threonine protein phosphatase PrpC